MGKLRDYLLGGATNAMAGDSYGAAPTGRPPKLSQVSESATLQSGNYFASDTFRHSFSSTPNNPSSYTDSAKDLANGNLQQPQKIPPKSARSLNGVRAPRCSLAPPPAVTDPTQSTRSGTGSIDTASEEVSINATPLVPEWPEKVLWEDYEIPQELELMRDDTPQDIRYVIQESMDEHRAMWKSRMQAQADSLQANEVLNTQRKTDGPAVAESSMVVSADSTSTSNHSQSNLTIPAMFDTSLGSDVESAHLSKPPTTLLIRPTRTSSHETLRTKDKPSQIMTDMERQFKESKLRTLKSHTLFRLLPHRRSREPPSPKVLQIETTTSECTSCLDDFPDGKTIGLLCRHKYCSPCFSQLVSTSIQNEASYPPKCCLTEIPKRMIRDNLPPLICAQFEEKALEYAVPVGNRYYCVSPSCAKWIDTRYARRLDGAMECPHCATKLCTLCRGPQHPSNEDCPQDFGLDRTLEQAERAGWRRCYNCRAMVELNTGCRHITCNCRAEFCYTCGAVWQTCLCTEGDQARREREIWTRLAQLEADQLAEEEELRAAMEAVETAERLLREEREAEERRMGEEARELQKLEIERLQKITDYYEYLREVLQRVRFQQTLAMEKRYEREWDAIDTMRIDLDSVMKTAEREAQVESDREKIITSTESVIKVLQRQHAVSMMEMITRHRKDQDNLFASSAESDDQDAEVRQAETLQELMLAQDLERARLKSEQGRDIKKWKQRGEASLQSFDSRTIALKIRLEEAVDINEREKEVRRSIFADSKWSEILFEERLAMLAEDERRLIQKGGEAPDAPWRDTVVMPETLVETPAVPEPVQSHREAFIAPLPELAREALPAPQSTWEAQAFQQSIRSYKEAADAPQLQSGTKARRMQRSARKVQATSANKATGTICKGKSLQANRSLTAEQRKELDAMMNRKVDECGQRATVVHA